MDSYEIEAAIAAAHDDMRAKREEREKNVSARTDCDRTAEKAGLTAGKIIAACDRIKALLLEKNRKYGNSALEPIRVFSKADPVEQLLVRIDDKLSRVRNRQFDDDEDVVLDLIGYLVLLKIAEDGGRVGK